MRVYVIKCPCLPFSSCSQNDFLDLDVSDVEETTIKTKRKIKSSSSARIRFNEENEKKFKKERRSAK